jgi:SAM-dependent methyltransferase
MHDSALDKARTFREAYLKDVEQTPITVLDVGSAVVDCQVKSNRWVMSNPAWTVIGMDIDAGKNVDIVVKDPYDWAEIATASVDVVTCSEVFEHAEFFWITILEIKRVLKPNGLAFITSPGGGPLHRFPVDCWRFYDDGLPAVAKYAGMKLLEAHMQWVPVYRKGSQWRDASVVLQRPALTPEGEREAAIKIALAKLLIRNGVTPDEIAAAVNAVPVAAAQPSVIAPTDGKDAFGIEERRMIADLPVAKRKAQLVMRRFKDAMRIIRTPFSELRA